MDNTSSNERPYSIPSEYKLSLKWESAFKKFGIGLTLGSVVGGISSIILFSMYNQV